MSKFLTDFGVLTVCPALIKTNNENTCLTKILEKCTIVVQIQTFIIYMSIKTKSTKTPKKTKVIQTRLDAELVNKANEILDGIGLTTSDIFRILLKKVVATGEVPLSLTFTRPYYNEEQLKQVEDSLDDIENGRLHSFKSAEEMDKFVETL